MNEAEKIDQVKKCETDLMLAMKQSDAETLERLFHDKLLKNIPSGYTMSKSVDIDSYRNGDFKLREVKESNLQINIIDDNAVVAKTIYMKGTYLGGTITGSYRFMNTWKLEGNQWQLIGVGSVKIG